jgi:arylsulfatase A-like enzyme
VGVPELCSPNVRNGLPRLHLDLNAVTIPEALKPLGYKSMLAGKWHLGDEPEYWPGKHGFDEFWGSLLGTPRYWNPRETYSNETPIVVDGYFTDKITDHAIDFIDKNRKGPFFLYLAYNAPHWPLEAPQELIDKYKTVFDNEQFAIYAAMVERMDVGIGRVFDSLREMKIDQNTFVVFMSDNGPTAEGFSGKGYGLQGAKVSAGPLREHKFSTFEGGIRVPAIAWWPGHIANGSFTDKVACTMDIFPTYMDILKADPGTELHGASMMPLLKGKNKDIHKVLHWEDALMWAVQKGKWKLVGRFWEPAPYLFDLTNDIGEQTDLASKFPKVVKELTVLHKEWQRKNYPDPFPRQTEGRPAYHFPQE